MEGSEKIQYQEISAEIAEMVERDQTMREKNIGNGNFWDDSVDAGNTARMKEIVVKIGWPTVSKVGKESSRGAWLLAQHADKDVEFQRYCLTLMKESPPREVRPMDIAYLVDRVRVNSGQPQLYGTQVMEENNIFVPKPIEDDGGVDQRRKEVGLESLKDYINDISEKYKIK
jgi:hypothetical protein